MKKEKKKVVSISIIVIITMVVINKIEMDSLRRNSQMFPVFGASLLFCDWSRLNYDVPIDLQSHAAKFCRVARPDKKLKVLDWGSLADGPPTRAQR